MCYVLHMANAITAVEPVQYPKVSVGGKTLTVKFNFQAKYLISRWKLSLQEILTTIQRTFARLEAWRSAKAAAEKAEQPFDIPAPADDPEFLSQVIDLFAACVAHNYTALQQEPPTPSYWAGEMQDSEWPAVLTALLEAMGKASSSPKPVEAQATEQPAIVQ